MVTNMVVHTPADYQTWVASQIQPESTAQAPNQIERAIAMNPATMTSAEYLKPYAQEMGVHPEMVQSLTHSSHH
jgi:cytochrome c oxidase subunit 2